MAYVICGDTKDFKGCLIYTCGANKEGAKKVLERMLKNPEEFDKKKLKTHTNLRVEFVEDSDCWWNYGCD